METMINNEQEVKQLFNNLDNSIKNRKPRIRKKI